MPTQVFISYRRSDTEHFAGRVADRLRTVEGIDEVFIDVDGIAPGEEFETKIISAIDDCSVCLLLIGQHWLGQDSDRDAARIFDDRDFIHMETRAALASGRKVLPVLADGALMPTKEDLPEDLNQLPRINGISIRHLHFNKDVESLIDSILSRKVTIVEKPLSILGSLLRIIGGGCMAAVALIIAGIIHNIVTDGRSLDESFGGVAQVWLLIFGILTLGALAPFFVRWFGKR